MEVAQGKKDKIAVWLDCDPGLDDILAIIYAAHSDRINLIGVSTSPGNSSLTNTTKNALDMLYHIGRQDVQVYAGSNQLINGKMRLGEDVHGENGLGGVELKVSPQKAITENGLQRAYERIMQEDGQIIWANTGSLTNLCIILLTYPLIKNKIKEIVIMGGAIEKGNITPAAQFNIFFDPVAFQNVLKLKENIPLVMIPLETTHLNIAGEDIYQRFKGYSSHPFGKALYNTMLVYQDFYIKVNKIPYPPYHDPLTILYILHPEEFQVRPANVEVDTFPTSFGRTNIFFSYPGVPSVQSSTFVTTNLKNGGKKYWDELLRIMDLILSPDMQKTIGIEY